MGEGEFRFDGCQMERRVNGENLRERTNIEGGTGRRVFEILS